MAGALTSSANAANIFSAVGGLAEGVGGIIQGNQQKNMGKYNATIYEQQATAERTSAALLAQQKQKIIRSQLGTQTALYAKAGIKNSGSPLQVALDSMTNANMDLAIDKYNSEVRARGYQSQADMSRYEGKQAAQRSYSAAGRSLLSTASSFYLSQREIGSKGKSLGAGTTSNGIKVPSRYVPPK